MLRVIRSCVTAGAIAVAAAVYANAGAASIAAAAPTPPCRQVLPHGDVEWWSADTRSAAAMRRWCETVGPVLFQPSAGATKSTGRLLDRLAVVSWNVHVGGGDVDRLIARLRAGEFSAGEAVEDFVLLLQEAYRRDESIPMKMRRGFPVPSRIAPARNRSPAVGRIADVERLAVLYAPSMRNGIADRDREDRGNAILSTLPLENPAVIELPLERQRRAVVAATVDGATAAGRRWRLRLVDAHLDTSLALTHGGPFAARRRQADALVAAVRATNDPGAATIVAGDFNTWGRRETALDALARAFPDALDRAGGDEPTWVGPLGLHAVLDHVFAEGVATVTVRRLPDRLGSDHYPLLAIVRF